MTTELKAERRPCTKCEKGAGVTTCNGCQQSFCIKHIIEHRQELAIQMDNIQQEQDTLRRDLIKENLTHPLLLKIDEWEQESIMKIKQAADTARDNLQCLLNQMKNYAKSSIDKIADELEKHRELDDYTDIELVNLSKKLTDIRQSLEIPSTIKNNLDQNLSSAIQSIKILENKQLHLSTNCTQEIFDKITTSISLSEHDFVATYVGECVYFYPTIFGENLYHFGVHHIRFRIENKSRDNFFFGIVTSSQDIEARIFEKSSANGWWGSGNSVLNGVYRDFSAINDLQTEDVINLTLDCDNKIIRLKNDRTNIPVQLSIDMTQCPFPWRIAISLSQPGDILRILP